MEQKSKYEIEIDNFRQTFEKFKDKRIAIYGIGRRSATLLPKITDYNIVGLLDRDENNVGSELCGVKVVSLNTIEHIADIIVINSDPSNYEIIYKRIAGLITIPVFYADGRLAYIAEKNNDYESNEYWNNSYEQLKEKIDASDVVSFDIFDTLVMRRIFSPEDVFRLLGERTTTQLDIKEDIAQIRVNIVSQCEAHATIDEIYNEIKKCTSLSERTIESIKQLEKDIDIQLCIARQDIKELYEYCIESGKEVYLLSDMYYRKDDIKNILTKCGIAILDDEHIWVSCERKNDKISGSMWTEYSECVRQNSKCLHIGDNVKSDLEHPQNYGIDTYYVMSGKDMLRNSSMSEMITHVNTLSDSICMGLVIAKLFNSPFALHNTNGKVPFEQSQVYGYCVYGPLLEKFLIWLYFNSRKDEIDKLLFFARDGYFLEKDYKVVSDLLKDDYQQDVCYLPIKSLVKKKNMHIETFLTAPYGMVRYIDENGNVICEPDKKSQKNFEIKQSVNSGVLEFICDYIDIYKSLIEFDSADYIKPMEDRKEGVEDMMFYTAVSGKCEISRGILDGFYFDNDFVGGREVGLEI